MALHKIRLLDEDRLLQSLKENGYHEIKEILDGRGINGQKLLELSEFQTRFWKLSPSQKTTLFDFIKDVTENPSLIIKPESVSKVYNKTKDQNEFKQLLASKIANSPFKKPFSSPPPPVPVKPPTTENPPIHMTNYSPAPTEPLTEYDHPRHLTSKPIPMQDYGSEIPDTEYDHPRPLIPKPEIIRHYPIPRHNKPPLPPQKHENKRSHPLPPLTGSSEAPTLRHPKSKPNIEPMPDYDNPRNQKVSIQQKRLAPLPPGLPEPMPENSQNVSIRPKRPPPRLPPALSPPEYINLQELNLTDRSNNSLMQMDTSNNLRRNKTKTNLTPEPVITPLKYPTNRLSLEMLEKESQMEMENSGEMYMNLLPLPPTRNDDYKNLQESLLRDRENDSYLRQIGTNLNRNKSKTNLAEPITTPFPPAPNDQYVNLQESYLTTRANNSSMQMENNLNRNNSNTNFSGETMNIYGEEKSEGYLTPAEIDSKYINGLIARMHTQNKGMSSSLNNLLKEQFYDETDDSVEQTYENINKHLKSSTPSMGNLKAAPPLTERPPIPLPGNNRPKSLEVDGQKNREIRDRSNSSVEQNRKINTSKSGITSPEANTTNLQQTPTKSTSNISPTPEHKWKSNDSSIENIADDQLRPNLFGSLNRLFEKKQAAKVATFTLYENYVPSGEDESRPQKEEKISFRGRPLPPIPTPISTNRNISSTPKIERNPGDLHITPNVGNISSTSKKEWNNVDLRLTSNTENGSSSAKNEWNPNDLRIRKPRNFEEMTLRIQKSRQSAEINQQQETPADDLQLYENFGNKAVYNMSHDPIIQETKEKLAKLAMKLSRALKNRTTNAARDDANNHQDHIYGNYGDTFIPIYDDDDEDDDGKEFEGHSGEIYENLMSDDEEANLLFDVSNEKFFRNTDRTGAKELLQNQPDGAFLFRPSQKYFLVLTLKYKGQCYNLGIERSANNKMRISADTASVSPEFKTLRGFVDYFTREAVTFRDNDDSIVEICLNPILSKNLI